MSKPYQYKAITFDTISIIKVLFNLGKLWINTYLLTYLLNKKNKIKQDRSKTFLKIGVKKKDKPPPYCKKEKEGGGGYGFYWDFGST